jgi:hypothetical protein
MIYAEIHQNTTQFHSEIAPKVGVATQAVLKHDQERQHPIGAILE